MNNVKKAIHSERLSSKTSKETIGVIELLLKDHDALRKLMEKVRAPRSTRQQVFKSFEQLRMVVKSHVAAEEYGLLKLVLENPTLKSEAFEGYEEHRVHEYILDGIQSVRSPDSKVEQMKAFCEILEHHLDEEEEDLFPKVKKAFAISTRKKLGKRFLRKRAVTRSKREKLGASKVILKKRKTH